MTERPTGEFEAESAVFQSKLDGYKELIDADIAEYVEEIKDSTLREFGLHSRVAADVYCSILQRGGKRLRGSLTMAGYEMCGGKDQKMIIKAARAIEMIHAYILIVDDFQDRSNVRRRGPTAHVMLAEYHQRHNLGQDSKHFGQAIAMNAALAGNHEALVVLGSLDVEPSLRLKALEVVNHSMMVTAHGQTHDIFNEVVARVDEQEVEHVLKWKTAHYSFLNPLSVGMILAGADKNTLENIIDYAMDAGMAFQITDDIVGMFGEEFESGKSPLDDIKEGKRTLLTVYALEHAAPADKNFLIQMLGNHNLMQSEFQRCKDILIESGALKYGRERAEHHVAQALKALDKHPGRWSKEGEQFLRGLSHYILIRTS